MSILTRCNNHFKPEFTTTSRELRLVVDEDDLEVGEKFKKIAMYWSNSFVVIF